MTVSKAETFRNIIYTSLNKGISVCCVTLTSMVVARNLTPSDYGVVGFAVMIIGFLSNFSDMGVLKAVVRRPVLPPRSLQTAFTLKIMLSSVAFIVALLIAPFARYFFDHPAISSVTRILALNFLLSAIGFLSLVTLTREMNYRALVIPGMVSAVVQCILAVALVLHGWSYWAVIIANLGSTVAGGVAMQLTRTVPVRFHFEWCDAQEYLRFGMPLLGTGILVFLVLNLDNFLVGSEMGSIKLGYYALAFTWGSFISGLLNDTVNNVLLPTFSTIQDNSVAMRRWYLKTIELAALIAAIVNTALIANAPLFLITFLGKGSDKWLPATSALRILCVYGVVQAMTVPIGICIMVRGHTKVLLRAGALAGVLELLLLLLALQSNSIELIAVVVLISYSAQAFIYLPYLRREFSISVGDLAAKLWPVVPAMAAGCLVTSLLPFTFGGAFFTLVLRGLFSASVVALTHGAFSRFRCFHEARGMIAQNFARIGG
jgi:O-antigen/teichoic acid export membrane protein